MMFMGQPLISVIIPAYNGAKTLRATVKSVLCQTIQDFEIIIVDDGSTDNTIEVANLIDDSRIRVISQPNGGASSARNTGIMLATGEYVAFLDADDLWLAYKLERQMDVLKSGQGILSIQSGVYYVNNDLDLISVGSCFRATDVLLETLLFQNLPGLMSTLVVSRALFQKIGLLNTRLIILEDWELAIRLSRYGNLYSIEEPLALYRQFPGNRSRDLSIHIEPGHIVLNELFNDPTLPQHIKKLERRIYASFYNMLSGGAIKIGKYAESIKWGLKAAAAHPAALRYAIELPLRKMKRDTSREDGLKEYAAAVSGLRHISDDHLEVVRNED